MFLSTPPSRVATIPHRYKLCGYQVSIHATLTGGDGDGDLAQPEMLPVSIHATLAGGDWANSLP